MAVERKQLLEKTIRGTLHTVATLFVLAGATSLLTRTGIGDSGWLLLGLGSSFESGYGVGKWYQAGKNRRASS